MMAVVLSAKVLVLANEWSARVFLPAPLKSEATAPSHRTYPVTQRSPVGTRLGNLSLIDALRRAAA